MTYNFGLGEDIGNDTSMPIVTMEDWDNFAKSVQTSSYETDSQNLTGMSALRPESLEPSLRALVAQEESFTFFKGIKRQPVGSALHEWNVQTSRGGNVDGMNIAELGDIQFDVGDYERHVERIKLFATGAQVSVFANAQTIQGQELRAREAQNGLTRIAHAVERALFVSNEKYSPNKINGFKAQVMNFNGGKNHIQLNGSSDIQEVVEALFGIKASVRQEQSLGDVDTIFVDAFTQNDLDNHLMPQYRVNLNGNPSDLEYGAPVAKIKTSYGLLTPKDTIWNDNADNTVPYIVKSKGKKVDSAPEQPTITVTPEASGTVPGGVKGWTADRVGEYDFAVALVDADGREGLPSPIVSGTVAEGGALRISGQVPTGSVTATGGRVYRSKKDPQGESAWADLRLSGEFAIPKGATTFEYLDVNQRIPGSSSIPVMHMIPEAIQWLQLRPAFKFELYPTNKLVMPMAVALFGTLQLGYPQRAFLIDGYLPKNANWKPF